jgi:Fe-S cluster assembly iron-binding protein IscA
MANARYNSKCIKHKQKRLGQRVYHDLIIQQAITAMAAYENKSERDVVFDTDSKPVGIDNHASAYISGDIDDFVGELEETNQVIKGFGGTRTTNVYRGTAVLKIEDNDGKVHKDCLPNSYYVPGTTGRLLSPQHWSRELCKQKQKESMKEQTTIKLPYIGKMAPRKRSSLIPLLMLQHLELHQVIQNLLHFKLKPVLKQTMKPIR